MTFSETCSCGASIKLKQAGNTSYETKALAEAWRADHAACRNKADIGAA